MLTLSELKIGEVATISGIEIVSLADRQKLFACGLVPGAKVSIVRIAPLGDPMQVLVDEDLFLSIRKTEGCYVKVDRISG